MEIAVRECGLQVGSLAYRAVGAPEAARCGSWSHPNPCTYKFQISTAAAAKYTLVSESGSPTATQLESNNPLRCSIRPANVSPYRVPYAGSGWLLSSLLTTAPTCPGNTRCTCDPAPPAPRRDGGLPTLLRFLFPRAFSTLFAPLTIVSIPLLSMLGDRKLPGWHGCAALAGCKSKKSVKFQKNERGSSIELLQNGG